MPRQVAVLLFGKLRQRPRYAKENPCALKAASGLLVVEIREKKAKKNKTKQPASLALQPSAPHDGPSDKSPHGLAVTR